MKKLLSTINATPVLLALFCGLTNSPVSAQPMHTPPKMPMAKAESVGMSSQGLARIEDVMNEHIEAGHIQGGVTIVARRGRVVHFSTHGEMDVDKGRAMENDAIFIMASSTKPVLGVAAMMMIEEGLMSPSDPVSKYIPEFADMKVVVPIKSDNGKGDKGKGKGKNKAPAYRLVPVDTPVTIHHLLTHTSGLTNRGLGWKIASLGRHTRDDTLASYVPRLAQVPLDFQPGTQWGYSMGLDIVARIIEIVSKTPFDEFLRERIFDPLEMNNTYFNLPGNKASKRIVLTGIGAEKGKDWLATTRYISASAGLSSTAEDFLHFEQMLLNGGALFGHRLLSPASVKTMSSNQVGDLFAIAGKTLPGMGFGYTVGITLDSKVAGNHRGNGAFGWRGAAGSVSWSDPENELVAVYLPAKPRGGSVYGDFEKAVQQAIID
ncbi:MAG: serine hydrolase [Gammaproteobacteria bacterium]|nr:serine hydrolase [Gammaproteobacteria bacterium]